MYTSAVYDSSNMIAGKEGRRNDFIDAVGMFSSVCARRDCGI
jgi:hypothetical protein